MKKLVFFTGAGVSAESGIPTFRDKCGLWTKYNPDEVASMTGWINDPAKVLEFHNTAKLEIEKCKPNVAHILIAELERIYKTTIVTQNIDSLHEEAGSSLIFHIHGRIDQSRSTADPNLIYPLKKGEVVNIGDLCEKNYQKRYNTVLFGDQLPLNEFFSAKRAIEAADILVVVGCSLSVYPAAQLLNGFKGKHMFVINPEKTNVKFKEAIQINEPASIGMLLLLKQLKTI